MNFSWIWHKEKHMVFKDTAGRCKHLGTEIVEYKMRVCL
jgi:hypothetical protein